MAMASFEIDDKFMEAIDNMIKRTGLYKTRSEFFKDSSRKRFSEVEEAEWRKNFREKTEEMSKEAYKRGYAGGFPTREERSKIADEFLKKKGIKRL